ncbi:hypothetical protein [Pseudaestuariivita atlantica]|uniref:Uncharacterized protein n=1 Tax=Pseudaestuariivita atlantica TaxID=1317121 RepID=A0A0L1JK30_9RHOB|nr:hypothetical protein [Pseudaestuariivita atlantica]KNG92114.1 hypothetical protein ATO11_19140 [Pseudaestuariivita atlantica]
MSAHTPVTEEQEAEARAFMLSTIAISTSVFGIAFFYGVFNTIFFEHLFYVWVASTVAMVASLFVPPVDGLPGLVSWRGRFVLILPSVLMAWLLFSESPSLDIAETGWFEWLLALVVVGLSLPYLLVVLIVVAIPDVDQLRQPRLRGAILAICLATVIAGFLVGRYHYRFITCHDFAVSGNFVPDNCLKARPGTGSR